MLLLPDSSTPIRVINRDYCAWRKRWVREETSIQVLRSLTIFENAMLNLGATTATEITVPLVESVIQMLRTDDRFAPRTILRVLYTQSAALKFTRTAESACAASGIQYAIRSCLTEEFVTRRRFQPARDEHVAAIKAKVVTDGSISVQSRCLLALVTTFGARPAELARMSREHVDLHRRTIELEHTKGSVRSLRMTEPIRLLLVDHITTNASLGLDPLWNRNGHRMTARQISKAVEKATDVANAPAYCGELRAAKCQQLIRKYGLRYAAMMLGHCPMWLNDIRSGQPFPSD